MSTKTTLKRIALVTVSALGFGLLATVPAKAAVSTFTASSTLGISDLTVVASSASSSFAGKFYLDVAGNGAAADDGSDSAYQGLFSNESIVVTVTAAPSGKTSAASDDDDVTDLTVQPIKLTTNTCSVGTETSGTTAFTAVGSTLTTSGVTGGQLPNTGGTSVGATDSFASNDCTPDAAGGDDINGREDRYWFAIYATDDDAIDAGDFTVRIRVVNNDPAGRAFIDKNLTVRFVSTIGNAGAQLTLASTGDHYVGEGLSYASGRNVTATLTDASGGRLQSGTEVAYGMDYVDPALNANYVNSAGTVGQTLYALDTGIAGEDHIAPSTYPAYTRNMARGNGVYGITTSDTGFTTAAAITQAAATTTVVRVRVTNSSVSSTRSIIIRATTAARDIYTDMTLSATGAVAYSTSAGTLATATAADVTRINVDSSTTFVLPLTTTSGTLTVNLNSTAGSGTTSGTNVTDATVLVTPSWSGRYVSASATPAGSTTGTSYTSDASGNISIPFTNTATEDGATLTLSITGFASGAGTVGTGSRTAVITWQKPVITTASVLDPLSGIHVKTGSATTFTVAAYDQFGNALSGEKFQPSLSSSSANYVSATTTYATITTGADGTATWTVTDAEAVADDVEAVTFTSVSVSTVTAARTITYKAALPVVATLTGYFTLDMGGTASTLLPSTGLGTTARMLIETARNQSRDLSTFSDDTASDTTTGAADTDDMVTFRMTAVTSAGADANGALCTVAASSGGHVLSAAGLPLSSRNFVVSSGAISWNAIATTPGTKTFTVTCGTATATALMAVNNDQSDARFITISGSTTGTANGDGVAITVTATDRFGNGVANVALTVTASGVGSFTGGSTMQSFTTNSSGTYQFLATSTAEAGGSATYSVSATAGTSNQLASAAARAGAVVIDSGVAAGNSSATHTITFAAGRNASTVAAEAANDAALEAIDAANAATDAANLAAEAADAATVAAEEARDAADAATAAVEALASEVATLIAGLKAQITTLANTVAKIAKKVKA